VINAVPAMRDVVIPAREQFPLAASVVEGESSVVIVNSATGVRRQYYRKFAQYLAGHGSTVVTYDYRGIGDSGGERTRLGLKARMRDWALLDASAVLDWAGQSYPDQPITVVGHSFGGQCLGLLENNYRISRAVFVGAQSGYWGHFAVRQRFHLGFLWYLAFPFLTPMLGYFPGRRLGLGEDLPAGVALEWARWCRQPDYLMGDLGSQLPDYFGSFEAPILAFKISDDSYAPARSVDALLAWYRRAPITVRSVSPQECGVDSIGHFGLFRDSLKNTLWKEIRDWINSKRR
jgi:predicted alpha/beta hydrolase